jgi:hypothetical protein
VAVVNLPFAAAAFERWAEVFRFNAERPVDGVLWLSVPCAHRRSRRAGAAGERRVGGPIAGGAA